VDRCSTQPLLESAVQRELGTRVGARTTLAAGVYLPSYLFSGRAGGCLLAYAFDFAMVDKQIQKSLINLSS
jgi:hypothetical protein